jgi:FkbM family methyltransferase
MTRLTRQLLTSDRKIIDITSDNPATIQHWENPSSYADVVLKMFNEDRFYDTFFIGKDDITVLDIGGNIGLFSLYVHDKAKAVYALEPTAEHFEILSELTSSYSNIHPLNIALHNKDEPVDFYISTNNSTMNSTVNQYGIKTTVQGKTLATIVNELGLDTVDFIKCDIEGSEMVALTDETVGAIKDKVKMWSVEVHQTDHSVSWEESVNRNRDQLISIFVKNGFSAYKHRHDCLCAYKV